LADLATQSTRPNSADQTTRELTWWRTQGAQRIGIAAFILFAYLQTIGLQGRPGIMWMNIYFPEDLLSLNLSEILDFFRDLRTGIPPAQALVEIGTLQYAGGDGLRVLMGDLYRLSLIASYVIAIRLSSGQSRLQSLLFWAALVLSAIFLRSTVLIHPQNAQLTDVVYPALIVLFVALLSKAIRNHQYPAAAAYALLSGLCLSLAELTRPFVLLLLPVIVIGGAAALFRRRDLSPRRTRLTIPCTTPDPVWRLACQTGFPQRRSDFLVELQRVQPSQRLAPTGTQYLYGGATRRPRPAAAFRPVGESQHPGHLRGERGASAPLVARYRSRATGLHGGA